LLLLDPGLGKTSITLAAIAFLKKKGLIQKVLIVAPIRVCQLVWPAERNKWKDFHGLSMVLLHGPDKEELLQIPADIYLVNPEGLDWLLGVEKQMTKSGKQSIKPDRKRWKKFGFDTIVIDEISKFKHHGSGRFRALKQVNDTLQRRWGLTGSPASNGLMGLFGICFIVDGGRTFGQFISHYRRKYFHQSYNGFGWELQEDAEEKIYDRIAPLALRMAAEDYIKMPTLVPNYIKVKLPDKARRIYDEVWKDLIAEIDERVVTAANSGVRINKCRQIANGAIYLDPDVQALLKLPTKNREWVEVHDEKIKALDDLIDSLQGTPLFVAYDYGHDLERLLKKFGKDTPNIGSGVTAARAQDIERQWNAGEIPLLLGHPQSVGHGLNLQNDKKHICWFSMIYDFELYDQFIRRIRRNGNKSGRVFVHHILAEDTVDDDMLLAMSAKNKSQQELFSALKKRAKMKY